MSKVNRGFQLLTLLFLIVPVSLAQTSSRYLLERKPKFKFRERAVPLQIIHQDESGYYILYGKGRYGNGSRSIVKFNQDLTPTDSILSLSLTYGAITARSLGIIEIKNKLADLSVIADKTFKRYVLRVIDLEKFKIISLRKITEIIIPEANLNRSFARFITSRDDSCIALFYTVPTKQNQNLKFSLILFDNDLNQIGKYNYELPHLRKDIRIRYLTLLNSEEAILLTSNLKTTTNNLTLEKIRDYNYTLIALKNASHKVITKIPNDNNWIDNPKMLMDDTTITILGYYGDGARYHAKGVFLHTSDRKSGQTLRHKLTPFSPELLNQYISLKGKHERRVRKHRELPYYVLFNIIPNEDSTMTFIGEQFWTESYNYGIAFFYQNLMLFNLNNEGDINWSRILKKDNSKSNTPIYSHYYLIQKPNDDLMLLYNGNSLNLRKHYPERHNTFNHPDGKKIIVQEIRKGGEVEGRVIANTSFTENYIMRPGLSRWIATNKLLLFAQNMDNVRNQRFMILTIPE